MTSKMEMRMQKSNEKTLSVWVWIQLYNFNSRDWRKWAHWTEKMTALSYSIWNQYRYQWKSLPQGVLFPVAESRGEGHEGAFTLLLLSPAPEKIGKFLDFYPLKNSFCPFNAPHKKFLVPPLVISKWMCLKSTHIQSLRFQVGSDIIVNFSGRWIKLLCELFYLAERICNEMHWYAHTMTARSQRRHCQLQIVQTTDIIFVVKPTIRSCGSVYKAVLEPRVSPAFAITYFCNHCNIRFENTSKYVDTLTLFSKNLNQRSLTPRWPLTPCLLRSHVWLYPRIIVSKSHGNTSMYVDTVINFANTTYRIVSNKRSPSNKRPPNLFSNKTR